MKKKDKYSQKDNFNINFDFDDIDFESIGQTIKNSVNYAVSSFSKGYNKNLPAAKILIFVNKNLRKNPSQAS